MIRCANAVLWLAIGIQSVFAASGQGVSSAPDRTILNDQPDAHYGISTQIVGDVNGDGFDDVVVGAYFFDDGESEEGKSFLYHGSAAGLESSPAWSDQANEPGALLGRSVAGAGDVNGDGFDDVIVGAPSSGLGGQARVFYGSASGLAASPDWTASSDQQSAWFGVSVGCAGDVNADGYDDVIVGEDLYDTTGEDAGRAHVFLGSSAGLQQVAHWAVQSNQAFASFGRSVAGAGDVNGDGFDDVIVGATGYSNGDELEGAAFVYHGSATGLSISPDWSVESNRALNYFGGSVAAAGDVNGDGFGDVIVGCRTCSLVIPPARNGRAFVYFGSASGLSPVEDWLAEATQADAELGNSVGGAGDLNADGYDDLIVGAWFIDRGADMEGMALIYYGSATGPDANGSRPLGTEDNADWSFEGDQADLRFGDSVSLTGDVNADGYADAVIGNRFYDNGVRDEGALFVFHGGCVGVDADTDDYCASGLLQDCNDTSADLWRPPGEVRDLQLETSATISWTPPLQPGATTVAYDTLRSGQAHDFALADCVEGQDSSDTTAADSDLPAPGAGLFYLVRARNGCPADGSLGKASSGAERSGPLCP